MDALRWTPAIQESLDKLEQMQEHPQDLLLVHLSKLQLINQRAISSSWFDLNMDSTHSSGETCAMYAQGMLVHLEHLYETMPTSMQQHSPFNFFS
jgi:hypothetical protein